MKILSTVTQYSWLLNANILGGSVSSSANDLMTSHLRTESIYVFVGVEALGDVDVEVNHWKGT